MIHRDGWVAEWFKAPVLKTGVGESPPWVRIPPHPLVGDGSRGSGVGGRLIARVLGLVATYSVDRAGGDLR